MKFFPYNLIRDDRNDDETDLEDIDRLGEYIGVSERSVIMENMEIHD
jgi:hypothetical protein